MKNYRSCLDIPCSRGWVDCYVDTSHISVRQGECVWPTWTFWRNLAYGDVPARPEPLGSLWTVVCRLVDSTWGMTSKVDLWPPYTYMHTHPLLPTPHSYSMTWHKKMYMLTASSWTSSFHHPQHLEKRMVRARVFSAITGDAHSKNKNRKQELNLMVLKDWGSHQGVCVGVGSGWDILLTAQPYYILPMGLSSLFMHPWRCSLFLQRYQS